MRRTRSLSPVLVMDDVPLLDPLALGFVDGVLRRRGAQVVRVQGGVIQFRGL